MEVQRNQFVWVEKFRPHTLDDCILPAATLAMFKEFAAQGQIPNLLLAGGAGMGKTTVARALCEDLGCDYILINGSEESGIDVLRTKIKDFASTVSLMSDRPKVVILDEADYLNPNSTQPALRGFIEEFSQNCRFIFTCNFKNRIIAPLHSRTSLVEFKMSKEDAPKMASKFMRRLMEILKLEGVTYDEKVVAQLLKKHFPDYRRVLNELQRYSASGTIDEGILAAVADIDTKLLLKALKEKDFKAMRGWVVNNLDNDPAALYRKFYDALLDHCNEPPQMILLLADYQYKAAFVADQEINLVACLTEMMASCSFK